MKTITAASLKGGSAKSVTSLAVATTLGLRGYRVLCVDLDVQGALTDHLGVGVEVNQDPQRSVGALMFDSASSGVDTVSARIRSAPIVSTYDNVDVLGSNDRFIELATVELTRTLDLELLARILAVISDRYEVCVIDTSPSLSAMTKAAVIAANLVQPVMRTTSISDFEGAAASIREVEHLTERNLTRAQVAPTLLTAHEPGTRVAATIVEYAQEQRMPLHTFHIPKQTSVNEAVLVGEPIVTYRPGSPAAHAYEALTTWIADTLGLHAPDGQDERTRETYADTVGERAL